MRREALKNIRESRGLKQGEAADAMGISRSYLSEIENGERAPSFRMARKIAAFYGLTVDQVIFPALESAEREQTSALESA